MSNYINIEHSTKHHTADGSVVTKHSLDLSDDYGCTFVELSLQEDGDVAYSPEYVVALAMSAGGDAYDMLSYALERKMVHWSGLACDLDPDLIQAHEDRYAERVHVHFSESQAHDDMIDCDDESE